MIHLNLQKVYSTTKNKIVAYKAEILLIIILIVCSWLFLYQNNVKLENLKKELLKITNEDKKLIEHKNKVIGVQEKIKKLNKKKQEIDIDILKNIDLEKCFKTQIERVVDQKESLIDYCEKEVIQEKEVLEEVIEEKEVLFNIKKLAKAVAMHETKDCTVWNSADRNNCFWIMQWDKSWNRSFKKYDTKEDSYNDFMRVRTSYYGWFPTFAKAKKYSWNDRAEHWLRNVTYFYYL